MEPFYHETSCFSLTVSSSMPDETTQHRIIDQRCQKWTAPGPVTTFTNVYANPNVNRSTTPGHMGPAPGMLATTRNDVLTILSHMPAARFKMSDVGLEVVMRSLRGAQPTPQAPHLATVFMDGIFVENPDTGDRCQRSFLRTIVIAQLAPNGPIAICNDMFRVGQYIPSVHRELVRGLRVGKEYGGLTPANIELMQLMHDGTHMKLVHCRELCEAAGWDMQAAQARFTQFMQEHGGQVPREMMG